MSSEQPNQSVSSVPSNQSPQEVIGEFERKYVEKMRTLNELKEGLTKAQTQVISAQSAAMDAFQQLVNCKEQYLIALVNNKQNQINALTGSPASTTSAVTVQSTTQLSTQSPTTSIQANPTQSNTQRADNLQ